jgi:hypothetical protein
MGKFSDLTGEFIGQLFVLGRMENGPRNDTRWECLCMCGNIKPVHGRNLKWGATKSCGCMRVRPRRYEPICIHTVALRASPQDIKQHKARRVVRALGQLGLGNGQA